MMEDNDNRYPDDEPGVIEHFAAAMTGAVLAILVACVLTLLFGCASSRPLPVPHPDEPKAVATDSARTVALQRDSIVVRDSVYIERWMKADTVFISRARWRTEYRDRLRVDTLLRVQVDSIPYKVEVEKVVRERYVPGFTRFLAASGAILWMLGLACVGILVWHYYKDK